MIADEERVDIHTSAESRAIQPKIRRPDRRTSKQRSRKQAYDVRGDHVSRPPHERPFHIGDAHLGVRSFVRAPVMRVARADTAIKHSANATYDGTIRRLNMTSSGPPERSIQAPNALHATTTGRTARPHTTVSTTTIEATVHPTRQITPARPRRRKGGSPIAEIL